MGSGDSAVRGDPRRRIAIDGYNLALKQGTGVATYGRGLANGIRRLGLGLDGVFGVNAPDRADPLRREIAIYDPPADTRRRNLINFVRGAAEVGAAWASRPQAREIVFSGAVVPETARDRLPAFDRVWNYRRLFTLAQHHLRHTGRRLRLHMADPPAVMHWTYPVPVELAGARNIYTVHDLVPLRLPHTTLDDKPRTLKLLRLLAAEADHLVTVSEASRRDLVDVLGVAPERVTNTWQSVAPPPASPPEHTAALARGALGLEPDGYLLFFGAIEPKKNVGRMIEAFLASGSDKPLVIVGKQAWKSEEELKLLFEDHIKYVAQENGRLVTRRKIILLDYAPFRLLVSLIRGAKAVLFPSLYEGFGLPALEAMSLGTPVLTSNTSSLPEVVGDAAVKVDPYDVRAMVEGIRALDSDDELLGHLSWAGRRQAAIFSAAAYERRLSDLYARLGVTLEASAPEPVPLPEYEPG